jgi:hypothetical protein
MVKTLIQECGLFYPCSLQQLATLNIMECLGQTFINCKFTKISISTVSICQLSCSAGVLTLPDKSLCIGWYCSKAEGLHIYKILQVRSARCVVKRLKKSSQSKKWQGGTEETMLACISWPWMACHRCYLFNAAKAATRGGKTRQLW